MLFQRLKNMQHVSLLFREPRAFLSKLTDKSIKFWNGFLIDPSAAAMIAFNRKRWFGYVEPEARKIVLVEMHDIVANFVVSLSFANVLAKKKGARIVSFGRGRWPLRRMMHAVYRSFNVSRHIAVFPLTAGQKQRIHRLFAEIRPRLQTPRDVFDLTVNGIHIGMDIYESYLKEFSRSTLRFDPQFDVTLECALAVFVHWSDIFDREDVAGVIVSHDAYIDCNILCRIAYQKGVPVYLPNHYHVVRSLRPHTVTSRFLSYRFWFTQLSLAQQESGIALAKEKLAMRLSGRIEGDMPHVSVSAFVKKENTSRVLRSSPKTKVLICTHCFYDNPHAYGGMLFIDFREWLMFLNNIAKKTDYDWYLKTHPDPRPGTHEIIRDILGPDSSITVIPSTTSPHQLVQEGLQYVLTVYGTVGHEYPAMGVQVVNAGYNPHVAYNFTWTPKDRKQYEEWLLNLPALRKDLDLNEVYQFYFMYYYFSSMDDAFYPSIRAMIEAIGFKGLLSTEVFRYVLAHGDEAQDEKVFQRFEQFIDTDKDYLFLTGPVNAKAGAVVENTIYTAGRLSFFG